VREFQLARTKYERKNINNMCSKWLVQSKQRHENYPHHCTKKKYRINKLKRCEKRHSQNLSFYWLRDSLHHEDDIQYWSQYFCSAQSTCNKKEINEYGEQRLLLLWEKLHQIIAILHSFIDSWIFQTKHLSHAKIALKLSG